MLTRTVHILLHPPIPIRLLLFSLFFLFHHVSMVRCTVLCSIISSCNFMPQGGGGGDAGFLVRNE